MRCRKIRGTGTESLAVGLTTNWAKNGTKQSEMKRESCIILRIDICGCKSLFGFRLLRTLG